MQDLPVHDEVIVLTATFPVMCVLYDYQNEQLFLDLKVSLHCY